MQKTMRYGLSKIRRSSVRSKQRRKRSTLRYSRKPWERFYFGGVKLTDDQVDYFRKDFFPEILERLLIFLATQFDDPEKKIFIRLFIEVLTEKNDEIELDLTNKEDFLYVMNYMKENPMNREKTRKVAKLFDEFVRSLELELGDVKINDVVLKGDQYEEINLMIGNVRFWVKLKQKMNEQKEKKSFFRRHSLSQDEPMRWPPDGDLVWDWRYGLPCYAILSLNNTDTNQYYNAKFTELWTEPDQELKDSEFRICLQGTDCYRMTLPVHEESDREIMTDTTWTTYVYPRWPSVSKTAKKLALKYTSNSRTCPVL